MVAVHNAKMIRNDGDCSADRADVLRDYDPALRNGRSEDASVVGPTELWPVCR
jgi:hypothetical protein